MSVYEIKFKTPTRPKKFQETEHQTRRKIWKKRPPAHQLQGIKQGNEESLEEFADKVQEMTTDGYPDTPEDCNQTVAVDAFLRGCTTKQAALMSSVANNT